MIAEAALTAFRRTSVLVVGDVMLDHYARGEATRLSPESPVPIVEVLSDEYHLGGAGNVAANVARFAASTVLVGAVGADADADRLRELMEEQGVETYGLFQDPTRRTTLKTRVFAGQHQVARLDREVDRPISGTVEARIIARIRESGPFDAVVIQDYDKGTMTPRVIDACLNLGLRSSGVPVVVDPKVRNFGRYSGATIFKPNWTELRAGMKTVPELTESWMEWARLELGAENLVVTMGAEGIAVKPRGRKLLVRPTRARQVFDVSGAGDTVSAIYGLALAAGIPVEEATELANLAAGIVVSKPGTATVSPEELLAAARTEFEPSLP